MGAMTGRVGTRYINGANHVHADYLASSVRTAAPLTPLSRQTVAVLGAPIDAVSWDAALGRLHTWSRQRESRYVCLCNVHSVVTAARDRGFRRAVANADMATPDGMPVSWMLRRQGYLQQRRISGPDLMERYCAQAATTGEPMFLYGATDGTLERLKQRLSERFPGLNIVGSLAPPFRDLDADEDQAVVDAINASGAGIVWVGLGCPKQEQWMAEHRGRIRAVMVGVGAAFDFHSGARKRAPQWMQHSGLEWLYRLLAEPRRLWRRYLVSNTLFVLGAARQLLSGR